MLSTSTIKLLRIPFSVFLSPLYFFALSQVPHIDWRKAVLVFIILHLLIYPASNGYNSYMDRDTESIGGLEKPPPPSRQLFFITIVLDTAAILLSFLISPLFAAVALLYIGASKAYSYRGIRLKKYPVIGYLTVIIFQGALTFALVYYGSYTDTTIRVPWQGMVICALLIGGFYPLTQIYQHKQDKEDGVTTLSMVLGYKGTFIFTAGIYIFAMATLAYQLISTLQLNGFIVVQIFLLPALIYFSWWFKQVYHNQRAANFVNTMRMTVLAAACSNAAFITLFLIEKFWAK